MASSFETDTITEEIDAGSSKKWVGLGKFFQILDASGPVTVIFYGQGGGVIGRANNVTKTFWQQFAEPFHAVEVQSATLQTVSLITSDARAGANVIGGSIDANITGTAEANYGAVSVKTVATQIKAPFGRRSICIQALDQDVYIGFDANVTTANGFKIAAGGAATFYNQLSIYGIAGATADVRFVQEW